MAVARNRARRGPGRGERDERAWTSSAMRTEAAAIASPRDSRRCATPVMPDSEASSTAPMMRAIVATVSVA
jgi:hypothetical protein